MRGKVLSVYLYPRAHRGEGRDEWVHHASPFEQGMVSFAFCGVAPRLFWKVEAAD